MVNSQSSVKVAEASASAPGWATTPIHSACQQNHACQQRRSCGEEGSRGHRNVGISRGTRAQATSRCRRGLEPEAHGQMPWSGVNDALGLRDADGRAWQGDPHAPLAEKRKFR